MSIKKIYSSSALFIYEDEEGEIIPGDYFYGKIVGKYNFDTETFWFNNFGKSLGFNLDIESFDGPKYLGYHYDYTPELQKNEIRIRIETANLYGGKSYDLIAIRKIEYEDD